MNYETRDITAQLLTAAVKDPDVLRTVATDAKDFPALPDVAQQLAGVAAALMHRLAGELHCDVDELLQFALTLLEADG